jgi:hypothetical protein
MYKHWILPTDYYYVFRIIRRITAIIFLNSITQLIFVIERRCVFCKVGTEFYLEAIVLQKVKQF